MASSSSSSSSPRKSPELGLVVLYEPKHSEPSVDVIAVHGIAANADSTWEKNGVNWLKDEDMLPKHAAQARIMRFAYESAWIGKNSIKQHCSTAADQLYEAIRTMRKECPERALVFIAHCFGGIVIQKAILKAKMHTPELVDHVVGAVFLGTPFKGSSIQRYATASGNLLSRVGRGNAEILGMTDPNSRTLMDQLDDFARIVHTQFIPLRCFFEQRETDVTRYLTKKLSPLLSHKEIIVSEDQATIPGHWKCGLAVDHSGLNRFPSPEDANYRNVLNQLKDLIDEAPQRLKARLNPRTLPGMNDESVVPAPGDSNPSTKDILFELCPKDPHDDKLSFQKEVGEKYGEKYLPRLRDTFFLDPKYGRWVNQDVNQEGDFCLWIFGEDGSRKTPLTISIIDDLKNKVQRSSKRRALAYFFCSAQDDYRNSAVAMLRVMLYQILRQRPESFPIFKDKYDKYARDKKDLFDSDALTSLWKLLQKVLKHAKVEVVYFIVFRPEDCGSSIMDPFAWLFRVVTETECIIKWAMISQFPPRSDHKIDKFHQIDLKHASINRPPDSWPTSPDSGYADSEAPRMLEHHTRSDSFTPMPPPAQEESIFANLIEVNCNRLSAPWMCTLRIVENQPPAPLTIEATRVDQKKGFARHSIYRYATVIPHTETIAAEGRKYAVHFLEEQEARLEETEPNKVHEVREQLIYRFQDETDFFTFQTKVHGAKKLRFCRGVKKINVNGERYSQKQDVRIWANNHDLTHLSLMFFANIRQEYIEEEAILFEPLSAELQNASPTVLELFYRKEENKADQGKRNIFSKLRRNSSRQEKLSIEFLHKPDKKAFIAVWLCKEVPKPIAPADLLRQSTNIQSMSLR